MIEAQIGDEEMHTSIPTPTHFRQFIEVKCLGLQVSELQIMLDTQGTPRRRDRRYSRVGESPDSKSGTLF